MDSRETNINFKKINFGVSDAKTEGVLYPRLLTDGYLDALGIIEEALNSHKFLFLGYKGTGKSALSEHLSLSNKGREGIYIREELMKSFPYKLFNKVVKGNAEYEARFPLAWRWLLLLYSIDSFENDPNLHRNLPEEWTETIKVLREAQLFPITSISEIVNKTSKNSFNIDLKILKYTHETIPNELNTDILVTHLKHLLRNINTDSRHYLIIDGLDDFLTEREQQSKTVIALLNEAKDLNIWFISNNIPFKIIILCRTDVFDRLSDSNINKIRQDFASYLNWFDESETDDYKQSNLVALANLRTKLAFPDVSDMFSTFFPQYYDSKPICNALLEYTRHIPRDFLQLLIYIQKNCKGPFVLPSDIKSGIKNYSIQYFKYEINNEIAGYLTESDVFKVNQLLSQLNKRDFNISTLRNIINKNKEYNNLDISYILSLLIDCSAIGHIKGSERDYYFKYRNPSLKFTSEDMITIHKALWKAINSQ